MFALLFALTLGSQGRAAAPPWPQPELRSPAGGFTAEVRKLAGQARVPDATARWQVRVLEAEGGRAVWSAPFPYRGEPRHYLLTDDGRALVQVSEAFEDARPVLRVARAEGLLERTGTDLGVGFDAIAKTPEGRRWLAESAQPVRLEWLPGAFAPAPVVVLELRDGSTLSVELEDGSVVTPGFPQPEPRVEPPAKTLVGMEPAMVRELEAPAFAQAGEPLALGLRGELRTPAWRLSGFRMTREADLLVLVPMAERRAISVVGPGVHEPFHGRPQIHDLPVGTWRVVGLGLGEERTPEQRVEVLPRGLLLRVQISGGIAGVTQRVDLYEQGVVHGAFTGPARWRGLAPSELAALRVPLATLIALPAPPGKTTPGTADLFGYELGWWRDAQWTRTTFDEGSIPPPAKPLLEQLRKLLEP